MATEIYEATLNELWNHSPFLSKVWPNLESPIERSHVRRCIEEGLFSDTRYVPGIPHTREYHARRIAFFVNEGYTGEEDCISILLKADEIEILDGYHRLAALFYQFDKKNYAFKALHMGAI